MLSLSMDNIGDLAIVECKGQLVGEEAACTLREAVTSHLDARTVVLDLSEMHTIEGSGLSMLLFLQQWAQEHDIRLKLFNPVFSVRNRLERANSIQEFDIAKLEEVMALLALAGKMHAVAA